VGTMAVCPCGLFNPTLLQPTRLHPHAPTVAKLKQVNTFQGLLSHRLEHGLGPHSQTKNLVLFFTVGNMDSNSHLLPALTFTLHGRCWFLYMDPTLVYYKPYDSWFPQKTGQVAAPLYDKIGPPATSKANKFLVDAS